MSDAIVIKVPRVEDFDRLFRRDKPDDCHCHDEPKKEPKLAKPCGGQRPETVAPQTAANPLTAAAPPPDNPLVANLANIWKSVAATLRSHGWTGAVKAHTPDGVAASVAEWLEEHGTPTAKTAKAPRVPAPTSPGTVTLPDTGKIVFEAPPPNKA